MKIKKSFIQQIITQEQVLTPKWLYWSKKTLILNNPYYIIKRIPTSDAFVIDGDRILPDYNKIELVGLYNEWGGRL